MLTLCIVLTHIFKKDVLVDKNLNIFTAVKPFLSKKSIGSQQKIVLVENDKIVNNTKDVCDTFNGTT
jgi:lipid II:glycine glycyltransferase (peptidoglycan interpeptide bridge formation enzyme)